jgi:hypothetical protein
VKFHIAGFAADRRYARCSRRATTTRTYAQALALVDEAHLERLLRETERTVSEHWHQIETLASGGGIFAFVVERQPGNV